MVIISIQQIWCEAKQTLNKDVRYHSGYDKWVFKFKCVPPYMKRERKRGRILFLEDKQYIVNNPFLSIHTAPTHLYGRGG